MSTEPSQKSDEEKQADHESIIADGRLNIGWKWFDQLPLFVQISLLIACVAFWPIWISSWSGSSSSADVSSWGESLLSDSEQKNVCVQGMGYVMSTPYEIMQVSDKVSGYFVVSYYRPSDFRYFEHRCRLDGNQLVWSNSLTSRWMNSPEDSSITF